MAEYYEGTRRYRRYRRPFKLKKWMFAVLFLAVGVGIFAYYRGRMSDLLYGLSEATVRAYATQALNDAALEALSWNGTEYDDLIVVTRGEDGKVESIEADAYNINLLARETTALAISKLGAACEQGVGVPLGAFTGMELFSGFGPEITFRVLAEGSVAYSFDSSFRTAGINQTLHSVYLDLGATVSIVLPSGNREIVVSTQVLLCESVLAGDVPDGIWGLFD